MLIGKKTVVIFLTQRISMLRKLWYSSILSSSLICFSLGATQPEPENLIQSVVLGKRFIKVNINESFKKQWLKSDFFARYEQNINLNKMPYSIALLPFILNVYPVVWVSGKDYVVDCMDEDVYYSLKKIKEVLQRLYPNTRLTGNIIPRMLVKNTPTAPLLDSKKDVAVLYSSGLDSTACSFDHYDKNQLLITAQGHGDLPVKKNSLWARRKKRLELYAQDHGFKNAFVKSNYSEFLNWTVLDAVSPEITSWRVDTTEGVGLFGIAAPILFERGYTQLLIGSSYVWDYPFPTAANPLIDDNLKAASVITFKHEHFNLNRFDKVKLIVDRVRTKNAKIPHMKVCDYKQGSVNCCRYCAKCQTVMNALFALGENPAPYGFNVPTDQIISRAQEYFAQGQGHWTSWNFADMQSKLKKLPYVNPEAQWLLTHNFMKKTSYHAAGAKTRVNWEDFKDLAPDSLEIPKISTRIYEATNAKRRQENRRINYMRALERKKQAALVLLKKAAAKKNNP